MTALERYRGTKSDVDSMLDLIGQELTAHAERAEREPGNYDLTEVKKYLKAALISLLADINGWRPIEAERFIDDHLKDMRACGSRERASDVGSSVQHEMRRPVAAQERESARMRRCSMSGSSVLVKELLDLGRNGITDGFTIERWREIYQRMGELYNAIPVITEDNAVDIRWSYSEDWANVRTRARELKRLLNNRLGQVNALIVFMEQVRQLDHIESQSIYTDEDEVQS